jgi:hypothetical protein
MVLHGLLAIAISLFVISLLVLLQYAQFSCLRAYEEDVIVASQIKYGHETGNFANDSNGISIRTIQNRRRRERKRARIILNSSLSDDLLVFEEQIRELEKQIEYSKNDVRDVPDTNTKKQAAREQKEWRDQIKAIKGSEEYKAAKKASKGKRTSRTLKRSYIFCSLNGPQVPQRLPPLFLLRPPAAHYLFLPDLRLIRHDASKNRHSRTYETLPHRGMGSLWVMILTLLELWMSSRPVTMSLWCSICTFNPVVSPFTCPVVTQLPP